MRRLTLSRSNKSFVVSVAPPIAPSETNYTIPGSPTVCSTQTQIDTALAGSTAVDIKVLNGAYTRTTPAVVNAGHRIWCESATGVTFNYGIGFNNFVGGEVHGGSFTIVDTAHAFVSGSGYCAIGNWFGSGTGKNIKVTDVTINGSSAIDDGVVLGQPDGAIVQRLVITNMLDNGIRISDNTGTGSAAVINIISDINVSNIMRSSRGAAEGIAESGIWVGHQVTNGVKRIRARNIGWMGVWTGNACKNTTFSDLDIDVIYGFSPSLSIWQGTGIYLEHYTRSCTIQNFVIGKDAGDVIFGIVNEWDDGLNAGLSGAITLPIATIPTKASVYNLTLFPASGTIFVGEVAKQAVAFTGKSGSNFTGCTGGTGSFVDGEQISTVAGGAQATADMVFQNGYIKCSSTRDTTRRGIFLDEGTMRPSIRQVTLAGMNIAAIADRTKVPMATTTANSGLTYNHINTTGKASGSGSVVFG